jgi:arabinan endo-1,5-alpha-L-arabinosidase
MGEKAMKNWGVILLLLTTGVRAQHAPAGEGAVYPAPMVPIGSVPAHDPVMIHADSGWYVFCTGMGVSVWRSADLKQWRREPPVFSKPPQWAVSAVPGFAGHIWAPDISYYEGRYYLYYAVSAFGKNTSCIGLATNRTLDARDPSYGWEDQGRVIESVPGRDMWNAIDPNLAVDETGGAWLAFGSFWEGIKLVKLSADRRSVAEPERWFTIAARARSSGASDTAAGDGAIEAPFIFHRGGNYYLFVSWDYCCRGEKSTYKIMVGRSEKIEGPYLDKTGLPMKQGGGSLVLEGDKDWYGVGHNAVVSGEEGDWMVFHGYDAKDRGRPKLRIEKLDWAEGWPVVVLGEGEAGGGEIKEIAK